MGFNRESHSISLLNAESYCTYMYVYADQKDFNVVLITRADFDAASNFECEFVFKREFSAQSLRYTRLRKSRVQSSHFMERRNFIYFSSSWFCPYITHSTCLWNMIINSAEALDLWTWAVFRFFLINKSPIISFGYFIYNMFSTQYQVV